MFRNFVKQNLVNGVFSDVASKYDLMNDLMSFGTHRLWKKCFIKEIQDYSGKIIDVACGSGDIVIGIYRKAIATHIIPEITATDINSEMIARAKAKVVDANICSGINFIESNAENLPFPDNTFDCYTIAFGIRNVENREAALIEACRILKPGGKFLCLEFSQVELPVIREAYNLYSDKIIPKIGKCVTKNEGAYKYLVDSIKAFPDAMTFSNMVKKSGFSSCEYETLTFGVVAIHKGIK